MVRSGIPGDTRDVSQTELTEHISCPSRITAQHNDLMALASQCLSKRSPNESCATGNNDSHVSSLPLTSSESPAKQSTEA